MAYTSSSIFICIFLLFYGTDALVEVKMFLYMYLVVKGTESLRDCRDIRGRTCTSSS
jgi:hypothetical protein